MAVQVAKRLLRITNCLILAGIGLLLLYYFYPEAPLPRHASIDRIVVLKSEGKMLVYEKGKWLKTYTVALGRSAGAKEYEGDQKTPEGRYRITLRNPYSAYHKNLAISYPGPGDELRARGMGKAPGGDVKIHGLKWGFIGKLHRWRNWTLGCIAVTNGEMDELYDAVRIGAVIDIRA